MSRGHTEQFWNLYIMILWYFRWKWRFAIKTFFPSFEQSHHQYIISLFSSYLNMTKHNQKEENKTRVFSMNAVIRLKNLDEVNLFFKVFFVLYSVWGVWWNIHHFFWHWTEIKISLYQCNYTKLIPRSFEVNTESCSVV